MKESDQIKALAAYEGYINVRSWGESHIASIGRDIKGNYWGILSIPDYLNCLNSMRRIEEKISRKTDLYKEYDEILIGIMIKEVELPVIKTVIASAKQRAEAALRVLGLWDKELIKVTGIEEQVCVDIAQRQQVGIRKYGTTVSENPLELKQWLQHAYEETLDNAIYLKRAITEIDESLED